MGIYSIKPYFQKFLEPISFFFIRLRLHPTVINFAAFFVSLSTGLLLFLHKEIKYFLLAVPFMLFVRIALNALDGMVARGLSVSSAKGEIYNEFFDRLSDISIFLGITFSFILSKYGSMLPFDFIIPFTAGFISILSILLNSYLGILSKSAGGKRIYSGLIGKADRMFYLGLAGLIYFFYPNEIVWSVLFFFLIAGTIISIGQRLWITVKQF
jgi:CDP-diacylglycerol--glycerol-3-phosphate 3-phosphatidyltransferase